MGPLSQETQLFVARSTLVAYFLSKTVGGPKKLYYKSPTQRRDVAATYAKPWSVLPEHNQGIGRYYMTFEILKRNRAALQYKASACEHISKGLPLALSGQRTETRFHNDSILHNRTVVHKREHARRLEEFVDCRPSFHVALPAGLHHFPNIFHQSITEIRIGVRCWLQRALPV